MYFTMLVCISFAADNAFFLSLFAEDLQNAPRTGQTGRKIQEKNTIVLQTRDPACGLAKTGPGRIICCNCVKFRHNI